MTWVLKQRNLRLVTSLSLKKVCILGMFASSCISAALRVSHCLFKCIRQSTFIENKNKWNRLRYYVKKKIKLKHSGDASELSSITSSLCFSLSFCQCIMNNSVTPFLLMHVCPKKFPSFYMSDMENVSMDTNTYANSDLQWISGHKSKGKRAALY